MICRSSDRSPCSSCPLRQPKVPDHSVNSLTSVFLAYRVFPPTILRFSREYLPGAIPARQKRTPVWFLLKWEVPGLEFKRHVKMVFWMAWSVWLLWPSLAIGGACTEFPWPYPKEMVMPEMVKEGNRLMQEGSLLEAQRVFSTYVQEQQEGMYAEGARWVLASLPHQSDEPGKEFLNQIQRLQVMKANKPDSKYAPWAICTMGQLYWGRRVAFRSKRPL